MDNKKFFNDYEYDLFRIRYTSDPSEELIDYLGDVMGKKGVEIGFQFTALLHCFTASGYELVNFLDSYANILKQFNEPFVRELKQILTGDITDKSIVKRITESKDRKDIKRVREGIVSTKDGNKTFEELYGNSIETDEEDDVNASMFAHCFESIAKKKETGSTNSSKISKLKESHDSLYDEQCRTLLEKASNLILDYIKSLERRYNVQIKSANIHPKSYRDTTKVEFSFNDVKYKTILNEISYGIFDFYYKTILKNKGMSDLLLDIELYNYKRDENDGYDDGLERDSINDHRIELHLTDIIDEDVDGPANIPDLSDEINILSHILNLSKKKMNESSKKQIS